MAQSKKPLRIEIEVKTGLHIGGSTQGFTIGGLDNPVIRDPITGRPYIPGSSIKGKIRCLLEINDKNYIRTNKGGKPCDCGICPICRVFGRNIAGQKDAETRPTRLIVRDAHLTEEDRKRFDDRRQKGLPNLEIKTETAINRVEGHVQRHSLRTQERIPPGWHFEFEIVYRDYLAKDENEKREDLALIKEGFELLMNDFLGGSGSRGYGQVKLTYDEKWFEE